jgi:hypothetical protein
VEGGSLRAVSRINREVRVGICERLELKSPGPRCDFILAFAKLVTSRRQEC